MPTCVVDFLLGRYCTTTDKAEIDEGLQIVQKQLASLAVTMRYYLITGTDGYF